MKKLFKFLGILILIVVALAGAAAAFIAIRGIPSYDVKLPTVPKIEYTPERVERGKKIATMLCASCHMDNSTGALTGHLMKDVPEEFGKVYSQNITRDVTYGIGSWTDAELIYLLRTGIKRDGQYSPPWMAKLPHMADEDINSIIAFLRSDDPMVAASPVPDQPCEPSFLAKFLSHVAFKPFPMPDHKIEMPDTNNAVVFGKYLANNLDCYACHSADFKTNDYLNPEKSVGYFGGGNKPLGADGKPMVTPNITPDPETGIGNWTEEQFVNAIKFGLVQGKPALRPPMMPFVLLTDNEAKAIYAYMRTVPPLKNKIVRSGL